jgi:hypothetical protein
MVLLADSASSTPEIDPQVASLPARAAGTTWMGESDGGPEA